MKLRIAFFIAVFVVAALGAGPARAENKPVINSTVVDVDGNPVAGAYIFFYDGPDTKRAVDLVSPVTDANGFCSKEIPPGSYWVLARLKEDADFDMGPLMIGDKVSGDPLEIEVKPGDVLDLKFTVLDLLDTIKVRSKKRNDLNRITGHVLDAKGKPLAGAFVFANRHNRKVTMPRYFSAWTEGDGAFTLYLPDGEYFLGVKKNFAPDDKYQAEQAITVDGDMEGVEVAFQ